MILPGARSSTRDTSSDPVETTATRGRARTGTSRAPTAASMARSPLRTRVPDRSTMSDSRMSSPARRTSCPGVTARRTSTADPPPPPSVSSTRTTASAPAGITAPVETRTAAPGGTAPACGWPARDSPARRSATGWSVLAIAVSSAWTANPSMAELSNAGMECGLQTSTASTRLRTSSTPLRPPAPPGSPRSGRGSPRPRARSPFSRARGSDPGAAPSRVPGCRPGVRRIPRSPGGYPGS